MSKEITAQVDSIYPGKVNISVFDSDAFLHGQLLAVGSYLHLEDGAGKVLIATVENISASGAGDEENMNGRMYRLEGQPLGMIVGDRFERGNTSIASSSDLFHEFCCCAANYLQLLKSDYPQLNKEKSVGLFKI